MTQLSLGDQLKEDGLAQVEANDAAFIRVMREYAREVSRLHGEVSADDLQRHALAIGLKPHSSHSWGAVCRGNGWRVVGWMKSEIPSNHGRRIFKFRYEGA